LDLKDKKVKRATNPFISDVSKRPHFLYTSKEFA
jgi:hypothetical protein